MGLCCGARISFASPPEFFEGGSISENAIRSSNPVSVHPMPLDDVKLPVEVNHPVGGIELSKEQNNSSNVSGSNSSKEQSNQLLADQECMKRRKQHRRRRINNQEQCVMRGVYFKNMKWQAAIKVDKKQIHLGTVSSPEEAAHLYDRAAFMCGREPNFDLREEEKQELRKYKWDEFLAMTRRAITSKKSRRRQSGGAGLFPVQNSGREHDQGAEGFSASDDVEPEPDASTSEHLFLNSGPNSFPRHSLMS